MSKSTVIYNASKTPQPVSNLLNVEFMISLLEKVPKDARICIHHDYEGEGGYYYVQYVMYNSVKNRVYIHACAEGNSNSANAMDKGARWFGGDIQSDSESDAD